MDTLQTSVTQIMQGQVAGYDLRVLSASAIHWLATSIPHIIMILIGVIVARKVLERVLKQVMTSRLVDHGLEGMKRAETLSSVIEYTVRIVLWAVASMMILNEFGIPIGPVLTAAGVVGLAVGFGAQKLVEDIIGGFFILLEDMIRVGDVVQIAECGGLVEKVTLRMVILRDLDGSVHYVRNGQIGTVTNMTKEYSRYVFNIGVAYQEDTDKVIEILRQVDEELRQDPAFKDIILEPLEILGVDQFADSAVMIKARTKTMPVQQWSVGREFNRRLKYAFDKYGIEIPFPHRTIYFGELKQGVTPAMRMTTVPLEQDTQPQPEEPTTVSRGGQSNTSAAPDPQSDGDDH